MTTDKPNIDAWQCAFCGMTGNGESEVLAHLREHIEIESMAAEATGTFGGFPVLIRYQEHPEGTS